MAILIDSDREAEGDALKPHAQRLVKEMGKGGGLAWVTAGRGVENYVDGAKLQAALQKVHPKIYKAAGKTGPYDHSFHFFRDDPKGPGKKMTHMDGDKVGAAGIVVAEPANLDVLDLRDRISELVQLVRNANGIGAKQEGKKPKGVA